MLHEFITDNQAELIDRCRWKVAQRPVPKATNAELEHGIPLFLEQLIKALRVGQASEPVRSLKVPGASGRWEASFVREHGLTIEEVVHDCSYLCQAVTDLAIEKGAPLQLDELQTLDRCLDNAVADAVMEFAYQRDALIADKGVHALNERLSFLAGQLRNFIQTATLAVTAIKTGNVGLAGATSVVLDRSLIGLRNLIDRSLADARLTAGIPARRQRISLAGFIAEVKMSATLEALARECGFTVCAVDPKLAVNADRDLLLSAVGNLLGNAFKFTGPYTEVSLNAYAAADRILIEVEDHCGGIRPGNPQQMVLRFGQGGADKDLGPGLAICRRSVEANNGILSVRDIPGSGCIFTIDLPRHSLAEPSSVSPAS